MVRFYGEIWVTTQILSMIFGAWMDYKIVSVLLFWVVVVCKLECMVTSCDFFQQEFKFMCGITNNVCRSFFYFAANSTIKVYEFNVFSAWEREIEKVQINECDFEDCNEDDETTNTGLKLNHEVSVVSG